MTVLQFKRPESPKPPTRSRRSLAEFATAMALAGLVFFMLPMLWSGVPQHLLAVIHLLIAVVYAMQGPRIAAYAWIALTLVCLVVTGAPSPVTYLLAYGARAIDAAMI